jgi:hypothetical protein
MWHLRHQMPNAFRPSPDRFSMKQLAGNAQVVHGVSLDVGQPGGGRSGCGTQGAQGDVAKQLRNADGEPARLLAECVQIIGRQAHCDKFGELTSLGSCIGHGLLLRCPSVPHGSRVPLVYDIHVVK